MRVLLNRQCLLFTVAVVLTVYTLSASAVPAKDHKKKLLEKLRNSLNQTELEEASDITLETAADAAENVTAGETTPEAKVVPEEETSEKSEEDAEETSKDEKKTEDAEKSESTEVQKTDSASTYLRKNIVKMRTVLRRLWDMFGFRQNKKKEGRQNRMLSNDDSYSYNGLDYDFRDDLLIGVGAAYGEKECIQKIICGAGTYLRDLNGKHAILNLLENVTPTEWIEPMKVLKKSAITEGECVYKCLEDDHAHIN